MENEQRPTTADIVAIAAIGLLLLLFMVAWAKSQTGHRWREMYRDNFITVERCDICGEERFSSNY